MINKMPNEEAITIIKQEFSEYNDTLSVYAKKRKEAFDMAIEALEQQPKTGHWIGHRDHCENLGVIPSGLGVYEWCSNCDCSIDIREWQRNHYNFCPNCGADMREVLKSGCEDYIPYQYIQHIEVPFNTQHIQHIEVPVNIIRGILDAEKGILTIEPPHKAESEEQESILVKIRAELIQSIQNGTLKIESENEELFSIIDKYMAESEDEKC